MTSIPSWTYIVNPLLPSFWILHERQFSSPSPALISPIYIFFQTPLFLYSLSLFLLFSFLLSSFRSLCSLRQPPTRPGVCGFRRLPVVPTRPGAASSSRHQSPLHSLLLAPVFHSTPIPDCSACFLSGLSNLFEFSSPLTALYPKVPQKGNHG